MESNRLPQSWILVLNPVGLSQWSEEEKVMGTSVFCAIFCKAVGSWHSYRGVSPVSHLGKKTLFTQENVCESFWKPETYLRICKFINVTVSWPIVKNEAMAVVKCKQLSTFQIVLRQKRGHDDESVLSPPGQAQKRSCGFRWHIGPPLLPRRHSNRPASTDINHGGSTVLSPSAEGERQAEKKSALFLCLHPPVLTAWHACTLSKYYTMKREVRQKRECRHSCPLRKLKALGRNTAITS